MCQKFVLIFLSVFQFSIEFSFTSPPVQNDYSAMNGVSHSTQSSSGKLSDPDSSDLRSVICNIQYTMTNSCTAHKAT